MFVGLEDICTDLKNVVVNDLDDSDEDVEIDTNAMVVGKLFSSRILLVPSVKNALKNP